jgi:hypothetical protein
MCFELGDRGDGMLSDEYLETARTLHCVALKVTDRTLANQVRAVADAGGRWLLARDVPARRVERAADIAPAIEAGIASGVPNLIEIPISAT